MQHNRNLLLDRRYCFQQQYLDIIAKEYDVIAFRPDYHAKDNDKNSVLFYLPEEFKRSVEMEKRGCDQLSKDYPRCFWSFENSDLNGKFDLDYANFGKVDMRNADWREKLRYSVELAMLVRQQNLYLFSSGGVFELREGDEIYNDMNRSIIAAFWKLHGTAFLGNVNFYDEDRNKIVAYEKPPFTRYEGEKVLNFGAAFIIPKTDETLEEMIRRWNTPGEQTMANVEAITQRIEWLGGKNLIWY